MNIETTSRSSFHPDPVSDDRIYNDSKGRPVGLAGRVNRITCSVEIPATIPVMTPEDKSYFNQCFERCVKTAAQFINAPQESVGQGLITQWRKMKSAP